MINLEVNTHLVYPAISPDIRQISARIYKIRRLYHGLPIELAKRDISRATKWAHVRPDMASALMREFEGSTCEQAEYFMAAFAVFPSGLDVSTCYFCLVDVAIQASHSDCGPADAFRNGEAPYVAEMFVGDATFADPGLATYIRRHYLVGVGPPALSYLNDA